MTDNITTDPAYYDDEIDLLDLLLVLARNKLLIVTMTAFFAITAGVVSLVIPPVYRATSRILVPHLSSESTTMHDIIQAMAAQGEKTASDGIVDGLLKSRIFQDKVIDSVQLMSRLDTDNRDVARQFLSQAISSAGDNDTGIITISAEDKDPHFAAELANSSVEKLQEVMTGLAVSDASQERLFLENQLQQAFQRFQKAQNALYSYQKKTGILDAQTESTSLASSIAAFKDKIADTEIRLRSMRSSVTPDNPQYKKAHEELLALQQGLKRMEAQARGRNQLNEYTTQDLQGLNAEYDSIMQEYEYTRALYNLIYQQYEKATINEASNPCLIQVVDYAEPPSFKVRPKRKLMVALATVLGFFVSLFAAFIREFARTASSDPDRAEKLAELKSALSFKKRRHEAGPFRSDSYLISRTRDGLSPSGKGRRD